MAATYEKLTPESFKKKMKEGGYQDISGARRAIGRMSEWSEADRDKARAFADKFFGAEAPVTKKVTKKTGKKAAKKTTKKAAKAAPPEPKVTKKPGRKKAKAASSKKAMRKTTVGRAKAPGKTPAAPVMDRIAQQKARIGSITEALNAMRIAKELGATASDVQEGAKVSQRGLTASVNVLCQLTTEVAAEALGGNSNGNSDALHRAHAAAVAGSNVLGMPPAMASPPESDPD